MSSLDLSRALPIEGWMLPEELAWLADRAIRASCIVEIGAWKGRATRVLGDHTTGVVYAVDHWQGEASNPDAQCSIEAAMRGADAVFVDFCETVGDLINRGLVIPMRSQSHAAADLLRTEGVQPDFVFIDGDHSEASCGTDIDAWQPLIAAGGILAGHDYQRNHPGVIAAVQARFAGRVARHKTIWWVQL